MRRSTHGPRLTGNPWTDDGVRLTYGGYDFLACRTFAKRDTIYSVGNQIGTGKESGQSQQVISAS